MKPEEISYIRQIINNRENEDVNLPILAEVVKKEFPHLDVQVIEDLMWDMLLGVI